MKKTFFIIGAVAAFAIWWKAAAVSRQSVAPVYCVLCGDDLVDEHLLNDYSEQGWQLVSIMPRKNDGKYYYYFKWEAK